MHIQEIYKSIHREMNAVEETLSSCLAESKHNSILKINRFLLESGGKRIRPALVILSAKASAKHPSFINRRQLAKIASAIELIHMASLIHDDVVDHARLRHSKPTINSKWGEDVSIALGDYLYSLAFKLISDCRNPDILSCISSAAKAMCEGELLQIVERSNISLLKEHYMLVIKKKTAALFAASCQAGALLSSSPQFFQSALKGYGLNFGVAFQIIDDYLDLVAKQARLGKEPGQDISVGEITLPLMNLLDTLSQDEKRRLIRLLALRPKDCLKKIKTKLLDSGALFRTKEITLSYLNTAKKKLKALPDSHYRQSLSDLADFISRRGFLS